MESLNIFQNTDAEKRVKEEKTVYNVFNPPETKKHIYKNSWNKMKVQS